MNYQLLNKYLNSTATEAEVVEVFKWIEASPENRKEFMDLKKAYALSSSEKVNHSAAWNQTFAPIFKKAKTFKLYNSIAKYAAILVLVFSCSIALYYFDSLMINDNLVYDKGVSIRVPYGQSANLELPDGTKITLNSGSTLTYNGNYSLGERKVQLIGEAFFEVAKDKQHPFTVNTSTLNFHVYGTSFNIQVYPNSNLIYATLIEGSLGVKNMKNKELLKLLPGENMTFDTLSAKFNVDNVNTNLYTSWKDGYISFSNEKLKDIAKKIERWYNVEIVITDINLGEQAYMGTLLKDKPIDQILEVFKLTSGMKYKIEYRADKPSLIYWGQLE